MSVYTNDVLIEGVRRDDVLAWLSEPKNHRLIVDGAWDGLRETGTGCFDLDIKSQPRPRVLSYSFDRVDEEHGGRRVHVALDGRRLKGKLHYSLRTTKPSTNTLVTLHVDFDGNGYLLLLAEKLGLRPRLEKGFAAMTENLLREIGKLRA
ncbi:hypothetical protein LBMAG42_21920 [Deltaproteobacteria bacterium]|nr:hypothetical protein LBMAG42_21920 [Deltaproteobacteria bacterium]